jgi:hypothetical protein
MAFGVNVELMDVRQRSVSASVSTSASMYRIPPCSSSSLGSTAFVVTLGCCFALLLRFFLFVLAFLCRRDGSVSTVLIFFACNSMMTVCLVLACLATIPFTLILQSSQVAQDLFPGHTHGPSRGSQGCCFNTRCISLSIWICGMGMLLNIQL